MVISSVVTIAGVIVLLRHKQEILQRDLTKEEVEVNEKINKLEKSINERLDALSESLARATSDLNTALMLIKVNSTEQAVIHKVANDTLTSLSTAIGEIQRTIGSHGIEIAVIKQRIRASNEN